MKNISSTLTKVKKALAFTAIVAFLFTFTVMLWDTPPPQTVVFDIEKTLDSYQDKLIEAGLNNDDHRQQLAAFDKALRQILNDYAKRHHLIIVVPGAVISGAPDMTETIQHYVIEELKHSS